ncbi:type II toxin-antitoxin system HipA family toxin [Cupriavidus sp. TMH.W2]|uniref:type II toxin-antitoxin system HipA family toxin n=1 Tax=Cupriavidus sp. TMH.W2 TaxID=3434465 RepID=UPI003D76A8CA
MGRRSHTRALGLWMNGAHVGTWQVNPRQGDTLVYAPEWAASAHGRPLSLSLPFTPGNAPLRGEKVRSYFDNLLPDSQAIRERIARRFQARTAEAFDLLAQIGRDCVGALQILPDGAVPVGVQRVEAQSLSEQEVAQILRATVAPPAPGGVPGDDEDFRISIAGAQEKTAFLLNEGQWCRPHGATPTTHIFKLPMGLVGNMKFDLTESVENEWLCSLILRAYGLPVASCEPLRFEDQKVLCVERFDRRWWERGGRWLIRVPQEDMCQATGTPPHLKYESDGGPGAGQIMGLLDGSMHRDADRLQFFRAQILFWMLCATDGHAKNFSLFLRPGGTYMLTPLYDVMSAYPLLGEGPGKLSPHSARMAMAVRSKNAHWRMREILRRHWLGVGQRLGIVAPDGKDVGVVVDDLIARTPGVVHAVRAQLPEDFPPGLADSILNGLQAAARKLSN